MPLERTCSSSSSRNCNRNINKQEPSVVRAEAIKWIVADRVIYLTFFHPATPRISTPCRIETALRRDASDVRDKAVGSIINAIFEWHSLYNLCAQVKILATSSSPSRNVIVRRHSYTVRCSKNVSAGGQTERVWEPRLNRPTKLTINESDRIVLISFHWPMLYSNWLNKKIVSRQAHEIFLCF